MRSGRRWSSSARRSSSGRTRLAVVVAAQGAGCSRRSMRSTRSSRMALARAFSRVASIAAGSLSNALTGAEAEPGRRDGQHARPAAQVGERTCGLQGQQQLEAQPRGGMRARAERLRRVDHHVEAARRAARPRADAPTGARRRAPAGGTRASARPSRRPPPPRSPARARRPARPRPAGKRGQLAGRPVERELHGAVAVVNLLQAIRVPARAAPANTRSACSARARMARRITSAEGPPQLCRGSTRAPPRAGSPR